MKFPDHEISDAHLSDAEVFAAYVTVIVGSLCMIGVIVALIQ